MVKEEGLQKEDEWRKEEVWKRSRHRSITALKSIKLHLQLNKF